MGFQYRGMPADPLRDDDLVSIQLLAVVPGWMVRQYHVIARGSGQADALDWLRHRLCDLAVLGPAA